MAENGPDRKSRTYAPRVTYRSLSKSNKTLILQVLRGIGLTSLVGGLGYGEYKRQQRDNDDGSSFAGAKAETAAKLVIAMVETVVTIR
ncbi:hypothetical protein BIW11_11376 [Tropilaelaps mercedesae]|uniref:Uncharacterized protein n=1 Tax=Tropilaelaps mercedesae TaxID=418985 RepID=A0A1V9XBA1_9ACAR|nr:hypothetical protein BIW11_11376 [Tropilaelaps mercedesae]